MASLFHYSSHIVMNEYNGIWDFASNLKKMYGYVLILSQGFTCEFLSLCKTFCLRGRNINVSQFSLQV